MKTGVLEVSGMGNGRGDAEPNRTLMAWIKNSAFLKQYIAVRYYKLRINSINHNTYAAHLLSPYPGKLGMLEQAIHGHELQQFTLK